MVQAAVPTVRFPGRVVFLTEDQTLIARQLEGESLTPDERRSKLVDNISTDEITPGWVCYYYDETLGRYALVGLRGGVIAQDALKRAGAVVLVSGKSKGCGSSREHAPYAELAAGIKLVIAESIEKIYGQNCQNIGLLTSTDFSLIDRIERGEELPITEFTQGLDAISASIVEHGGLFAYNKARLAGLTKPPTLETPARPMTIVEKIIAAHAIADAKTGALGIPAVKPGDALFVRTDVRFSHEYVTPMAASLFQQGFGKGTKVADAPSVFAFRDHLTFLDLIMPRAHREMGLDTQARSLADVQQRFADGMGIKLYGEVHRDGKLVGSEAICHNMVIEELGLPGQIITGTDSHSCMAGALGAFAFGVGATDMANAWFTRDVRVKVPETVRFVLTGALAAGVCAKDVMLHLLSQPFFRGGDGLGKVLEFTGSGVVGMSLDERATLTNMAVEAGGFTGIIEADDVVVDYLHELRGTPKNQAQKLIVRSDPDAHYFATFEVDLGQVEPMVAKPGDPRNGVPLREVIGENIKLDIAYGGSCTGGKKTDMDMYASVLKRAVDQGKTIAPGVQLYIQFGSQRIRQYAIDRGYLAIFEKVGAQLVDPSCGACIKAGPGVSDSKEQVTVSAINRNFPGRSGPGQVWLASPLVVAASALLGRLAAPE